MKTNILSEGRETLEVIREKIVKMDEAVMREKELAAREEGLESTIETREKMMAAEIASLIDQRREEIEATFDGEDEKLSYMTKNVRGKREKTRSGKVSERIAEETEPYLKEIRTIQADTKRLFKQTKTPRLFNTEFFYTLFTPSGVLDLLFCGVSFLVIFGLLPYLLWLWAGSPKHPAFLVLFYIGVFAAFGALYLWIFKTSRANYMDTISAGKLARSKIKSNKRLARKIAKSIRKDRDDTGYGLHEYDAELEDLKMQSDALNDRKKEALRSFDEVTQVAIAEEIKNKNKVDLDGYKVDLLKIKEELSIKREEIKQAKLYMAENYEGFIGKETMNLLEIGALIRLMEEENLSTIGEVLEARKKKLSEEDTEWKQNL